jgi:hypothetical protein
MVCCAESGGDGRRVSGTAQVFAPCRAAVVAGSAGLGSTQARPRHPGADTPRHASTQARMHPSLKHASPQALAHKNTQAPTHPSTRARKHLSTQARTHSRAAPKQALRHLSSSPQATSPHLPKHTHSPTHPSHKHSPTQATRPHAPEPHALPPTARGCLLPVAPISADRSGALRTRPRLPGRPFDIGRLPECCLLLARFSTPWQTVSGARPQSSLIVVYRVPCRTAPPYARLSDLGPAWLRQFRLQFGLR